jgi:hypothetical protein
VAILSPAGLHRPAPTRVALPTAGGLAGRPLLPSVPGARLLRPALPVGVRPTGAHPGSLRAKRRRARTVDIPSGPGQGGAAYYNFSRGAYRKQAAHPHRRRSSSYGETRPDKRRTDVRTPRIRQQPRARRDGVRNNSRASPERVNVRPFGEKQESTNSRVLPHPRGWGGTRQAQREPCRAVRPEGSDQGRRPATYVVPGRPGRRSRRHTPALAHR